MKRIRFKFSPAKTKAAILWMLRERPGIDLHTLLKACYFADKLHLNGHGRPVFGASYRAMRFGPVPVEIYEMAKGEALWLADLRIEQYPWTLKGYHLLPSTDEEPDMELFSPSDREALRSGFEQSCGMTFDERTAATHGKDWQAAHLGFIKYEDMIEDDNKKLALVEYLREISHSIKL